jgi:hypothetical protein
LFGPLNGEAVNQLELGPYANVVSVDITGLNCSVTVVAAEVVTSTVSILGSVAEARRIGVNAITSDSKTRLAIADSLSLARMRSNARLAENDASGFAERWVITPDELYSRQVADSPVTVTVRVRTGTVVVYR